MRWMAVIVGLVLAACGGAMDSGDAGTEEAAMEMQAADPAVRDASTFLDQPGVSLTWEPSRADIAASGDLGWTTGRYVLESPEADGEVVRGQGVYVSLWRRQDDGSWKGVMDLGNPAETSAEG